MSDDDMNDGGCWSGLTTRERLGTLAVAAVLSWLIISALIAVGYAWGRAS